MKILPWNDELNVIISLVEPHFLYWIEMPTMPLSKFKIWNKHL